MSFDYLSEEEKSGGGDMFGDGGTIFFNRNTSGERFRVQFLELPKQGMSPDGGNYAPYKALLGPVKLVGYGPKGESVATCGPFDKEICAKYTACPDLTANLKKALGEAGWAPGQQPSDYDISGRVFEIYRENRKTRNGNVCMHLNVALVEEDMPF
tara:strand:- start:5103 stop:5567 length:465 start_codon:yes stop_codon:yes gene_type:complete